MLKKVVHNLENRYCAHDASARISAVHNDDTCYINMQCYDGVILRVEYDINKLKKVSNWHEVLAFTEWTLCLLASKYLEQKMD